jgi:hypothetical protein
VLGQLLRNRAQSPDPAEIYFWRDAHGTEVDFVIWQGGRLHLVEVKWSQNGGDSSHLKPMHKVRGDLGKFDAGVHLLACRTPTDHWHPHDPTVRVVDAYRFRDWFSLPMPPTNVLREDPVEYGAKPNRQAKAKTKKASAPRKK